ncbi:hypothetical protein M9Y10_002092 [Tritrichomonas musculus]|uniref:Uncharacterized protein n=1 Tax=Tritrichomonas musculus TaxID=1915356 RepID=A0ABR2L8U1_9EUKA
MNSTYLQPRQQVNHPLYKPTQLSDALQAELDIILATTNAEEELAQRKTEVKCASTSATFKQIQFYRRQRKQILQQLIKEKKEYIEILKQKIADLDSKNAESQISFEEKNRSQSQISADETFNSE